jgi:hypothetical protein
MKIKSIKPTNKQAAVRLIRKYARRNAFVRYPNPERRKEGQTYKKGYEIRLPLSSEDELRSVQKALADLGFSVGKPYKKHIQMVLPIYGRDQVYRFIRLFRLSSRTKKG